VLAQQLRRPIAEPPTKYGPGEYWQKTWEGAAEEPQFHVIDKSPWGEGVQGLTVCDKDKRQCHILILRNADRECVEAHERKHAAGYDHPDYPRAFICPR
jgi:hypothetical protein